MTAKKSKSAIRLSARAKRNADWIHQHLRVPEGRLVGQPVQLSPAQMEWMEMMYGSPTRTFIASIPRKNGKTSWSAMILLLHLAGCEAVPSGQLYSCAQSRDQAAILFRLASLMVRMSPDLSQYVAIKDSAKMLVCSELGTVYKALSADASTALGLSPALVIHDELGAVRGPRFDLYEAMETAAAAQQSPMSIVISTQAAKPDDLLSILIQDAKSGADPRVKCVLYAVPEDGDPFDREQLAKAQPNWHLMNHEEVFRQMEEAKRMPAREASFRNLVANQCIESKNPFVTRSIWESCGAPPEPLEGKRVWGGLDLSSVSDLTALVLVSDEGDVHPTFWLPAEGLSEKSRADRVPYDIWGRDGWLETTPGRSIQYEFIAAYMRDVFDRYDVQAIAFDRYNMRFLKPCLERAGFSEEELERFVEFGQGFVSMSPALRELESKILNAQLKHGNHPVLSMCLNNATVVQDPAENRKFVKSRASGRIDGAVALAMAVGVMPNEVAAAEKSFWDI
jgi:phage terminase large subunit-like protein